MSTATAQTGPTATTWTPVARIVLPAEANDDVLPLYADFSGVSGVVSSAGTGAPGSVTETTDGPAAAPRERVRIDHGSHVTAVEDRTRLRVGAGEKVSFATYFNAFPASYWQRWTSITAVRLTLDIEGEADVTLVRSTARGASTRMSTHHVVDGRVVVELPLKNFGDGGWYWFDLAAGPQGAVMAGGAWEVAGEPKRPGRLSIGITTFNRPDYCVRTLRKLGESTELADVLDTVYLVDQGTQLVADEADYPAAASVLGDRLEVIRQPNLGGSGGFSRGMYESVRAGRADYHLVLDDDVDIEPESMLRSLQFAEFARKPMIVGGHMFNITEKSMLHVFGESVQQYSWTWGPNPGLPHGHDFAVDNLRSTPWLHERADVDYNGWWMCLIPTAVIRELGLALPVFIKWDDAEYGLRAKAAGYPTVSLPGAAVWHMPWTEKDDTVDWQAYFHARNRAVTALLYSPYPGGGSFLRQSFSVDVMQTLAMQYYAHRAREMAVRDVLRGPDHLHETIATRLPELRAMVADYPDAAYQSDPEAYPEVRATKPPKRGKLPTRPSAREFAPWVAKTAVKAMLPVKDEAKAHPQVRVPHSRARWWNLSQYDSALVTKADGSGVAWLKKDPDRARHNVASSAALYADLRRRWSELSKAYREALPEFTSFQAWERTFGIDPESKAREAAKRQAEAAPTTAGAAATTTTTAGGDTASGSDWD